MLEYFQRLNPRDIWNIGQNRPSLIARDLEHWGVPPRVTYAILLGRGVFKWLAVRRDLIKLKNVWKSRITQTIADIRRAKQDRDPLRLAYLRGYLRAYEEARGEVRTLCHSSRFRAPDCDKGAQRFLQSLCEEEGRNGLD